MMNRDDLRREWLALSQAWIKEAREGRNPTRNGLLDLPMLEACGSVAGLKILDCGCGEGRFCRLLVERGAGYVLGLDLCEPMIEAARALQSEHDAYRVADVQALGFIEDETFDLAVSYLNQCDLPWAAGRGPLTARSNTSYWTTTSLKANGIGKCWGSNLPISIALYPLTP